MYYTTQRNQLYNNQSNQSNNVMSRRKRNQPIYHFNKITILIRNTYRPNTFSKCIQSVLRQEYTNYRIIMCYDDDRCMEYLEEYRNHPKIALFNVKRESDASHFYNLYCNYLLDRVRDGWILFLDDDNMLSQPDTLKKINNNIKTENDIIFWKVKLGEHIIFPNIYDIKYGQISTIGFCFHSKYKNAARWIAEQGSDFHYVTHLLKKHYLIRRAHSEILTQSVLLKQFGQNGRKEEDNIYNKLIFKDEELDNIYNKPIFKDEEYLIKKINNLLNINNFQKKIYIISWTETATTIKGINIDTQIIYNCIKTIGIDIDILTLPQSILKNGFNTEFNNILLDRDIYIFSEVCLIDIYNYLFKHNKNIICIPNIDSYSTYKPIIKDRETDYINLLKELSNKNFTIWCKTKQIYNWLNNSNLPNIHYIHFSYYITTKVNNYKQKDLFIKPINKDYILLDTGGSTTKRKYLEEILDIFIKNKNIPFVLLVKTTETIYNKFLKNTKYDLKYNNIIYIIKTVNLNELSYIYSNVKYLIYCSKFDGYGLSLAQAIQHSLFIFTLNGLPWSEILENYPRKCLINCSQDFTKSMGGKIKGKALSQIYYKADFEDLKIKLLYNKHIYENIINNTNEQCNFIKIYNEQVFVSNIYNYFQNKYNICNIYNTSAVKVVSFKERGILFIENLLNIITQSNKIYVYLNSTYNIIINFLSNISNVRTTLCKYDLKSLTKLKDIDCLNEKVNYIIDDDIIYPPDYIAYTYNILNNQTDKESLYSFNGYNKTNKYPFTIKTLPCKSTDCNLGTGTLFFYKDAIKRKNLHKFVKNALKSNSKYINLFCDKLLLTYCKENNILTRIISPKYTYWLKNNKKMKEGLFEIKTKLNIYDLTDIKIIPKKDILVKYNNSISSNIIKLFKNKITIESKETNNIYNIHYQNSVITLENSKKEPLINVKLDFSTTGFCVAKDNYIKLISKLYFAKTYKVFMISQNRINKNSTETYIIDTFKKFELDCSFITITEFLNTVSNMDKNIDKNTDKNIYFYNLKNDNSHIDKLNNSNFELYGYTYDLIGYNLEPTRAEKMIYNINKIKKSFIVEDSDIYTKIINKCHTIFQPTKVVKYNTEKSTSNNIKFVHFGRISSNRLVSIFEIAYLFPEIDIYLYGAIDTHATQYTKSRRADLQRLKNIFLYTELKIGIDMYKIVKNNNTFVVSFSERPNECYYSNRIPMLCGYRAIILQQSFYNIEKYFNSEQLIIFNKIEDLKIIMPKLINNYNLQNKYRENALNISKKYSFENYVKEILMNIF